MYINLTTINLCPTSGGGSSKPEETFSVEPTTTAQTVTPQEGHVFSGGTVAAVTSSIDQNIQASNIKSGVTILGVTGTVSPQKPEETFSVAPGISERIVTPLEGYVFSSGVVTAVDSTIDANIEPGNIKDGVTILGVTGTYTGGSGKNYSDYDGRINGLADLGWDEDSIGYAESNIQHYSWQNADYAVTQANKDLYGVFSYNNKGDYSNNPDMEYVPMFDVPSVQSLDNLFHSFTYIKDIPILDFTGITYMQRMFYNCTSLRTIPMLETGHLVSLGQMFQYCSSLESIPKIDTGSNVNFNSFFEGCSKLKSIPDLDTSSATMMEKMFFQCSSLTTIPLLDTSSVTSMGGMFNRCSSLTTVPALDTSSVRYMNEMFYNCTSLTTVPVLDTGSVTDMQGMFSGCSSLTTVNGIDFSSMRAAPNNFLVNSGQNVTRFIVNGKIDFTWNTSWGLNMLTKIDFDSVKSILQAMSRTTNTNAKTMMLNRVIEDQNGELAALIADCQTKGWTITGLSMPTGDPVIHYTSKDGNIVAPASVPSGLTVVSNVYQDGAGTITFSDYPSEIGERMYSRRSQLDTIEIPDEVASIGYAAFADGCGITRITIPSNVTRIGNYVFSGATSLIEVVMESAVPPTLDSGVFNNHNADLVIKVPASAVDTYKAASGWSSYASLIVGYETLQDIGWDAQSISYYGNQMVTSANAALYGVVDKNNKDSYGSNTDMEYVPMFDTTGVTDMETYFRSFSHIKGLPILDTSSVTDMAQMFGSCTSLTAVPLMDTSSVTSMGLMFAGCTSLTAVPLMDTSSVTDMNGMFQNCTSLTTIPLLDTGSVTDMRHMFDACSRLTTVPALDTSSVTSMDEMFVACYSLTTVPALDTSSVTSMYSMFSGCSRLTTVPTLDTSKVTNMSSMFSGCSSLTTVNGIDFSSMTAFPSTIIDLEIAPQITHFIINGKLDVSFSVEPLINIDYDSVKSGLQAMSRTTKPGETKYGLFNRTIADQNGELAALVADCQTKGWTITGLTIQ